MSELSIPALNDGAFRSNLVKSIHLLPPVIIMRLLSFIALVCLSFSVIAAEPTAPAKTSPPAKPSFDTTEPVDEPQVTITKDAAQTVEEFRANGKLYMIKITPKHGVPYYLVDDRGDGKFARQESLDSGLRVPRWVIFKF